MVVVTMIVGMVIMGTGRMRIGAMCVVMMLEHITARIARMRPEQGDQPRENGADQRQKDNCLDHVAAFFAHDLFGKPVPTFPDHAISPSSD